MRIPQKGVTVVLACSDEADIVAAYARLTTFQASDFAGYYERCGYEVS